MTKTISRADLLRLMDEIGERPDAEQYRSLSDLVIEDPAAEAWPRWTPSRRPTARRPWPSISICAAGGDGYEAQRDEASTEP